MSCGRVDVVNRQRGVPIDVPTVRGFLEAVYRAAPPGARLAVGDEATVALCFVSDRRMRELNRRFRGVDRSTDVLAFPDGEPSAEPGEPPHLGDIVIAAPTALRQSVAEGRTLEREVRVLALHGYLHLLGYDHETDDGEMLALQGRLERRLIDGGGA